VVSSSFQAFTKPWPALPALATTDARIDAKVSVEALACNSSSVSSELNMPSTNVPVALPTSLAVGTTSVMSVLPNVATSANSPTEASVSSKGRLTLCLMMVLTFVPIDLLMVYFLFQWVPLFRNGGGYPAYKRCYAYILDLYQFFKISYRILLYAGYSVLVESPG